MKIKDVVVNSLLIVLMLLIMVGGIFTLYKLQEDRIVECRGRGGTYGLVSMMCQVDPLENRVKELEDRIKELE